MTTKAEIRIVTDKVREAIKTALEGTGYELVGSRGRFGDKDLSMAIEMFKGGGKSKGATDWEACAVALGLPADGFDKVITITNGREMKIVGLNLKKPKNVVALEEVKTGKPFMCSVDAANRGLDRLALNKILV